ncbi:MAG: ComF family protein [Rhodospirillales bacterium]|nr:ComF family protein [Rhodospirillales bacterium]
MVINQVLDFILPPRCVMSGTIVDRQGTISPAAWQSLNFIAAPYCHACGFPFEFSGEDEQLEEMLCAACLQESPAYDGARAALVYDDASRELILRFKHADQTHAARVFVPWFKQAGRDFLPACDVILPVPLHPRRLLKRRYNQAALLARELSKDTGIPCLPMGLVRQKATVSQGHMKAHERHKNVRGAFAVHPRHAESLRNQAVLLVDDVYTTGATVTECTKALRKAGVKNVYVLAAARVVRSHDHL